MPSIEIVSLDADKLDITQSNYDIAIIEENRLRGHRGLFDSYLKGKKGVMIHLGNPSFKNNKDGGFFAGQIISWDNGPKDIEIQNSNLRATETDQQIHFKFLINYQIEVADLLTKAIESSLSKMALFMTDYQFGPSDISFKTMKLSEFWKLHDKNGLIWNSLYQLTN